MQRVGSLILGADAEVAAWVKARIPGAEDGFGECRAVGVVRGGVFVGGVVFHNYRGHVVEMSAAFDDPRWCLPGTLSGLFDIPFNQYGCATLVTVTRRRNARARRIDEGLGFRLVGPIPKGWDGREDAMLYAMERRHCRWLKGGE